MDRSHAANSQPGQQHEHEGGGSVGGEDGWKQGNARIVYPSLTSPISTSASTFSHLTSTLSNRLSSFVASQNDPSTSTSSPPLHDLSSGSVPPSAFSLPSPSKEGSSSSSPVWSAFDELSSGARTSATSLTAEGGLRGPTRVLLKAQAQDLSIWSAPASPSGTAKELVRISGKGRLEWRGGRIVGAKILGGGDKAKGALRVMILLNTVDSSALVAHSLETLELLDSITLNGQAAELQTSGSFIAVSTTSPTQLHILSSTSLLPHQPPITTLSINPHSRRPTFTLSHRFLSYASSLAPVKSMPLIVRLGGDPDETAGTARRREPTLSPSKVIGTIGGLVLGGPGGSKVQSRAQGAGVEGTLVDVAGRFVSGGTAAGLEGMKRMGTLVAGFAATSISTPTTAISMNEPASSRPPPPLPTITSTRPTPTPPNPSRLPIPPPQDNSIVLLDLLSPNPSQPIIHFYLHPNTSPTREQINFLSLSPSGRQLLVAQSPSTDFRVLEIRPKSRGSSAGGGEVWERCVLKRGLTPGLVTGVEWDEGERGVGVLSGRGTIHIFLLNLQGGTPQGHLHGKAVNSRLLAPLSTVVHPIVQVRPQIDPSSPPAASRGHRRTSSSSEPTTTTSSSISPHSTFALPTNFVFLPNSTLSLMKSPKSSATSGRRLSSTSPSHHNHHLPPSPSIAKDLLIFEPERESLRIHRTILGAKPSSSSGLSLMLNQKTLVAGGSKEVVAVENETTVARWEFEGGGGVGGEVRMAKLAGSVVSPRKRDASPLNEQDFASRCLSRVEIETSSPSFKILSSPIYLSRQFEFHVYDASSLSDFSPRQLGSLLSDRLVVRKEVQVSSSSFNQLSSLNLGSPSLSSTNSSAIGSPAFSLEQFPSSSSRRSSSSHSHSQSIGPGSFDASLETAIHTFVGHPRSRAIVPSYPNGDGPTTSPRSWKSPVPIGLTVNLLGEGVQRFRKEVNRTRSSKFKGSSSLPNQASLNVLSFEEGTIYDENDFASARSSGGGGHATNTTFDSSESGGGASFEEWEEEDDSEEAYRKAIEEEEYDDLIVGVMDDEEEGRVVAQEARKVEVGRVDNREKKRGKVSAVTESPMGSAGEEMKHSEVGSGSGKE